MTLRIKEIEAKTVVNLRKRTDSWFLSNCGMNLYRGCSHNCSYCDGRAEGYYTSGIFSEDIEVKINAPELLLKELEKWKKKSTRPSGFLMIGGGVCDTYQPIEKKYELTRKALEILTDYDFPVAILTKSTLVQRDIDLLKKINEKTELLVSFSFSSCDDSISRIFEPGVPPPSQRLETIRLLKSEGISCGMFLMPVIPFITDTVEQIERSVQCAADVAVDFIIFSGMTLKEGRQKRHFMEILNQYDNGLPAKYEAIYTPGSRWGNAAAAYYNAIQERFYQAIKKTEIPARMYAPKYRQYFPENDYVYILLDQIDFLLKLKGRKSVYNFAAYSVSILKEPISGMKDNLESLKGVGPVISRQIIEILESGTCGLYESLIR